MALFHHSVKRKTDIPCPFPGCDIPVSVGRNGDRSNFFVACRFLLGNDETSRSHADKKNCKQTQQDSGMHGVVSLFDL
jgi:ssDNA-binding Zn-finger/Zn-ribbon topoisomerase 1